jgi:thiamine transport system ATP-binding protein
MPERLFPQGSPAIRFDEVVIAFPDKTLRFHADIEPGTITAVIGASGSGKSTLLNLAAGFETPDSGRVVLMGADVTHRPPEARPVSVIFQEHNLFAHLDAGTNVGLGIDPRLKLDDRQRERVEQALADVGLAGFARRLPPTLSGGERQRVALARALVRERPVLLLDEPFAALDPGLRSEMGALLRALHQKTGATVLIVTHHAEDVGRLSDRVLFLEAGAVLLHEPSDAFLDRREPVAAARFLGRG